MRIRLPIVPRRGALLMPSLSSSLPNLVICTSNDVPALRSLETPVLSRRLMGTITSSGALVVEPKPPPRFGLLKAMLAVVAGISIGAYISKQTAQFLEENELFVPDDDDDDGDDDD